MSYTVGMVSLGCPKNQVDGEMLLSSLQNAGFTLCTDVQEADAVLVNTCGFIESAKKESIEEILKLARLKQQGRLRALVVTGCLAERYREQIQQEMPEVDVTVGIGANGQIADLLANALQSHSKVEAFPEKDALPLSGGRILSTPPHTAYLKIAEGCDNRCSYCAIPLIRGRFRSRPIDDVVQEAEALAQSGVKELIVVAQDTTRYGEDLYGRLELPALLRRLCRIPQVRWIRLLYCYPNRITEELLDCMAKRRKSCAIWISPSSTAPAASCGPCTARAIPKACLRWYAICAKNFRGLCCVPRSLPASRGRRRKILKNSPGLCVTRPLTAWDALPIPRRRIPPPPNCRIR